MKGVTRMPAKVVAVVAVALMCSCKSELDRQLVDAAAEGDAQQVAALLSRGANIEARARDDWTPLTVAAREGHGDVVRLLLKRGAAVNAKEGGGHTALFWASKYNKTEAAALLKDAGGRNE